MRREVVRHAVAHGRRGPAHERRAATGTGVGTAGRGPHGRHAVGRAVVAEVEATDGRQAGRELVLALRGVVVCESGRRADHAPAWLRMLRMLRLLLLVRHELRERSAVVHRAGETRRRREHAHRHVGLVRRVESAAIVGLVERWSRALGVVSGSVWVELVEGPEGIVTVVIVERWPHVAFVGRAVRQLWLAHTAMVRDDAR